MFDDDDDGDRPSLSPPPERPLTIPAAVLWFVTATAGTLVLIEMTRALRPGSSADLVNAVACQAAAYGGVLYLVVRLHNGQRPLQGILGIRATHPAFYGIGFLLGLSLQIPAEALQRIVFHFWPESPDMVELQAQMMRMDTSLARVAIPLAVVVVGPMIEEMFFRGALLSGLRRHHGEAMVVLVIASLFAGAHGSPQLFLPLFVVGAIVTMLRTLSGSLVPSLIAHMTFNAVPVFGVMFGWITIEQDPGAFPLSVAIGGTGVTLVLLAAMLYLARRNQRTDRARQEDLT